MPSPFPGMDPYLEDSEIWPGFHHLLADELVAQLNPLIGPKYYADVEVRTVLEEVSIAMTHTIYPDTGIVERTLSEPAPGPTAEAVAIPEAPVRRVALVPGQTKLRAVRVYVTETGQLVTSIEILSAFNKRLGEGLDTYRLKRARLLQSPVHLIEIDLLRGGQRPGREVKRTAAGRRLHSAGEPQPRGRWPYFRNLAGGAQRASPLAPRSPVFPRP